mmetsp:Transcript_16450/g.49287  ORF Transcript_16450/g.49287 Transcript_16450/m.49287 type:complete len:253 (+) Transcript_16450:452-1210(+)
MAAAAMSIGDMMLSPAVEAPVKAPGTELGMPARWRRDSPQGCPAASNSSSTSLDIASAGGATTSSLPSSRAFKDTSDWAMRSARARSRRCSDQAPTRAASMMSATSTGSPTSTRTSWPGTGTEVPRGMTRCMPSCTMGSTTGSSPAHPATRRPTPARTGPMVVPSGDRVPSGKMCTHSPAARRACAACIPGCCIPRPRSTGSTWPARKKAPIHLCLKQRSVAHRPHRMAPDCSTDPSGVRAASSSGSSIAAT